MAPKQAGATGSIFFGGLAPFMAALKQQSRPTNLFVCHYTECKSRWEYCGRYEIANEDSYIADADLREGEDGHGDVWSKEMSEGAKTEFAQSAANANNGWGAQWWVDEHPEHELVGGRNWREIPVLERVDLVRELYVSGLMKQDRIQLRFVDYDEDVYQALVANEENPQNLKVFNSKA